MYKFKRDPTRLFARDSHPELPLDPDVAQPGVYLWPLHLSPIFQTIVFIGGSAGAAARYGISLAIPLPKNGWPAATLLVNLAGAFLLGLLLEALARRGPDMGPRRVLRLALGTGFMGAFTTYSTLAVEVDGFLSGGHYAEAALYAAISLFGGVLCAVAGIQAAAAHHRRQHARGQL